MYSCTKQAETIIKRQTVHETHENVRQSNIVIVQKTINNTEHSNIVRTTCIKTKKKPKFNILLYRYIKIRVAYA